MAAPQSSARSLPPLSATYQSSQLMTPRYLQRVTIDQSHYHGYISHSLHTDPPHLNALQRRVHHYGDQYFHLHRDIPVHQPYSLTPLQLSALRPWDQIVDRPLSTNRVIKKEFSLPFPAEHPYSSHISHFAVFPDTHPHSHSSHPTLPNPTSSQAPPSSGTASQKHTSDSCTQTPPTYNPHTPQTLMSYYVTHKASERGVRVEQQRMPTAPGHVTHHVTSGGQGQLWDLPRSRCHQRSQTYPSPLHRYPPSQTLPTHPHLLLSSPTQEALSTIHSLTSRTTTYRDHFPTPSSAGNCVRSSYSACFSERPFTAESRGKYSRRFLHSAKEEGDEGGGEVEKEEGEEGEEEEEEEEEEERECVVEGGERDGKSQRGGGKVVEREEEVGTKDVSTQTDPDEEHFPPLSPVTASPVLPATSSSLQQDQHCDRHIPLLPQLTKSDHIETKPRPQSTTGVPNTSLHHSMPNGTRMWQCGTEQALEGTGMGHKHQRSLSADAACTPRSVTSARRFSELYSFSRSEVQRRFHQQYPEQAPDLRQYGIQTGKRHIIHGYHAYYYH